MIPTGPYLIVAVEQQYNDTVKYKSLELKFEPRYRPTFNLVISGIAIALPEVKPFDEVSENGKDIKKYINPIIQEGDKVYFRYVNNDGDLNLLQNNDHNGNLRHIRVPYRDVFCLVRNSEIIPVGNWILGEPVLTGIGEVEEVETETGKKKVRVEYFPNSKLVKAYYDEHYADRAKIKYISSFIGDEPEVSVGDVVVGKHLVLEENVEGQTLFRFEESQLDCIV